MLGIRLSKNCVCVCVLMLFDIHSDYDVFLSPLEDFKKKIEEAGLQDKVVYLDRKDRYDFQVKG